MEALQTVKATLSPRLDALVQYLGDVGDIRAAAFFSEIAAALKAAREEGELLEVFLALSTTAFQGFQFDPAAAADVDEILAYAEQVSHTFAASENVLH
jgi:hypothetical protein